MWILSHLFLRSKSNTSGRIYCGAIYLSKEEEHYKHVDKNCLIFSALNIVLGFIMIAAILGSL